LKGARTVLVEGHADARSTERYNVDLALRRARVVAACLERALPVGRVRPPRSLGEMAPVASNETAEGRRRNRRVEVIGIW
jgi:outer membrane protein OmpA-like peptidoglycan-associated protein